MYHSSFSRFFRAECLNSLSLFCCYQHEGPGREPFLNSPTFNDLPNRTFASFRMFSLILRTSWSLDALRGVSLARVPSSNLPRGAGGLLFTLQDPTEAAPPPQVPCSSVPLTPVPFVPASLSGVQPPLWPPCRSVDTRCPSKSELSAAPSHMPQPLWPLWLPRTPWLA